MQFFVRNPREGHTKLIRNIPVTTDKLIYEIVINFDIIVQYDYMCVWVINVASFYDRLLTLELFRECTFLFFILCYNGVISETCHTHLIQYLHLYWCEVTDESYSRNVSCTLNSISTFLLM